MFIFIILALAVIVGLVRKGNLGNFADLKFRWQALILLGFLIQVVIYSDYWQAQANLLPLTPYAYITSLLLLTVALTVNYQMPGMPLIALGFFCNFIAIALNGGYMPGAPEAYQLAGFKPITPGQINHNSIGLGPDTRFGFLGDVFAIPKGLPFPNVFSIGDVLITLGAVYLIQKTMVKPSPREQA
jgi:hypothetical protein